MTQVSEKPKVAVVTPRAKAVSPEVGAKASPKEASMEGKKAEAVAKATPNVKMPELAPSVSEMSDTVGNLFKAIAQAQAKIDNGSKGKEGYGYKYQELGSITSIIRGPLSEVGLCVIQSHSLVGSKVMVETLIGHASGEWFKSTLGVPMTPMKQLSNAQIMGIAMTYGRRYALQSAFLIAAEDDTDATIKGQ